MSHETDQIDTPRHRRRAVEAICFFCVAIGIALSPVCGALMTSAQFGEWGHAAKWALLLAVLGLALCYTVRRYLDRFVPDA